MLESTKSDAKKTFDRMTDIVKDTVMARRASVLDLIENLRVSGSSNSSDQKDLLEEKDQCTSNITEKILIQLNEIKFEQLVSMSKTFENTLDYFSSIFTKCSNVNMQTRCTKLIVS